MGHRQVVRVDYILKCLEQPKRSSVLLDPLPYYITATVAPTSNGQHTSSAPTSPPSATPTTSTSVTSSAVTNSSSASSSLTTSSPSNQSNSSSVSSISSASSSSSSSTHADARVLDDSFCFNALLPHRESENYNAELCGLFESITKNYEALARLRPDLEYGRKALAFSRALVVLRSLRFR